MSGRQLWTGIAMTFRELLRSRYILLLVMVMPVLFFNMISLTSSAHEIGVVLGAFSDEEVIRAGDRQIALVFFGNGAISLIACFIGMKLVQRQQEVSRRLVLCGYRSATVLMSRLGTIVLSLFPLGLYVGGLLLLFFMPERVVAVVLGFVLSGLIYAACGVLIGALLRGEVEGVLAIVLLANIDAVWMQHPAYYTASEHREVITWLPGWFPTQLSMIAAFTRESISGPLTFGSIYALALVSLALFAFWRKMRVESSVRSPGSDEGDPGLTPGPPLVDTIVSQRESSATNGMRAR